MNELSINYRRFTAVPHFHDIAIYISREGQAITYNAYRKTYKPTTRFFCKNPKNNHNYYTRLNMSNHKISWHILLHRAVALLYVPGCDLFRNEIDHLNNCKWDNRADNLEWVTRSENMKRTPLTPARLEQLRQMTKKSADKRRKRCISNN